MTGEFELIDEFTRELDTNRHVTLGVGDDAAGLAFEGDCVVSTDMLVENVHFKKVWSDATQVGRKAIAVNVSDIEAMGAKPVAVVVGFAMPKDTPADWIRWFTEGLRNEAADAGVAIVGGDLSRADHIVISVTALGDMGTRRKITRDGARPGDVVAFRGRLGWAGAGHAALSRGFRSPVDAVQAALVPKVPYGQGIIASDSGATAMIDVSDGLVQDLGHIAKRSGVHIDIDSSTLEVAEPLQRVAAATGKDPLAFVLAGGEDYALAATFPDTDAVPEGWAIVGNVAAGEGVTVDGTIPELEGWDHFAR